MSEPATILIVDDDAVARELLETHLTGEGYRIETASRGQEALEKAASIRPDLVLLDVMMPQMNGFEVCRRLRADPALAEVPVIMITALDDSSSKLEGIEAGADDFLSKPYDAKRDARPRAHRDPSWTVIAVWWTNAPNSSGSSTNPMTAISCSGPKTTRSSTPIPRHAPSSASGLARTSTSLSWSSPRRATAARPHHLWKKWPEPPATPLFLLLPESPGSGALWLRVDLLALPSEKGVLLVRLRDQTSRMALGRNLFQFQLVGVGKTPHPARHDAREPRHAGTGDLPFLTRGARTPRRIGAAQRPADSRASFATS